MSPEHLWKAYCSLKCTWQFLLRLCFINEQRSTLISKIFVEVISPKHERPTLSKYFKTEGCLWIKFLFLLYCTTANLTGFCAIGRSELQVVLGSGCWWEDYLPQCLWPMITIPQYYATIQYWHQNNFYYFGQVSQIMNTANVKFLCCWICMIVLHIKLLAFRKSIWIHST